MKWPWSSPVRLLEEAKIPTPSSVMTDLLTIKIAGLTHDEVDLSSNVFHWDRSLGGDNTLHVRVSTSRPSLEYADHIYRRNEMEVKVGISGSPKYRTVDLSDSERYRLIDTILARRKIAKAQNAADREVESQLSALYLVEKLI